ncbi:MAG: ATP-binding protein [Bdellovibrionales bacterium]|nr:ATP-binding protein [Bdellovibrionales bacterium]
MKKLQIRIVASMAVLTAVGIVAYNSTGSGPKRFAFRGIASVIPSSVLLELEEQFLKRVIYKGIREGEEVLLRKEIRSLLMDELGKIEQTTFKEWDDVVKAYASKEKSREELLLIIKKISGSEAIKKMSPKSSEALKESLEAYTRRLDESKAIRLIDSIPDFSSVTSRNSVVGPRFTQDFHLAVGSGNRVFSFEGHVGDSLTTFKTAVTGKPGQYVDQTARFDEFFSGTQMRGTDLFVRFDAKKKEFIMLTGDETKNFQSWYKKNESTFKDVKINSKGQVEDPEDALYVIEKFVQQHSDKKVGVLIYNSHFLMSADQMLQGKTSDAVRALSRIQDWATNRTMSNSLIVLSSPIKGSVRFTSPYVSKIAVDLPEYDEILRLIRLRMYGDKFIRLNLDPNVSEADLARAFKGLNNNVIDLFLARISKEGQVVTLPTITKFKQDFILQFFNGKLAMRAPTHTFDDAKLAMRAQDREEIEVMFEAIKVNDLSTVPTGIYIGGLQNTGKTYLAEGMATSSGFTVFEFNNLLDKYIGESERVLQDIFDTAKSMGNVGFWIDEADKFFGLDSNNVNEVSQRILAMFLLEMGDKRNSGKLLFMLASSRIENMMKSLDLWRRLELKVLTKAPATLAEKTYALKSVILAQQKGADAKYFQDVKMEDFEKEFIESIPLMPMGEYFEVIRKARRYNPGKPLSSQMIKDKFKSYTPLMAEAEVIEREAVYEIRCRRTDESTGGVPTCGLAPAQGK